MCKYCASQGFGPLTVAFDRRNFLNAMFAASAMAAVADWAHPQEARSDGAYSNVQAVLAPSLLTGRSCCSGW